MEIISVFNELKLFSSNIINIQDPIDDQVIDEFENKLNLQLPNDYKNFLMMSNGLVLMGSIVYGIGNGYSLLDSYNFEHFQVDNPMPINLIPFSPDVAGNLYCFDVTKCNLESCKIVFWQHDIIYNDINQPEIVYDSFTAWLKQVIIDWTLKDFDYDGNPRA